MSKVFISYSRDDIGFVKELHKQFESNAVETWVDWRDIPIGFSWRQAIYDGILKSTHFLPVVSPSYMQSEMCRMESHIALAHNKIIIPVMYRNSYLEETQYSETKHLADLRHMDYTRDNIYGMTMNDSERFQNILTVVRGEIPNRPECIAYLAFPSQEIEYATRLWTDLEANGISTWMTNKRYYIGEDWNKVHWRGLQQAKVFLPILTTHTARSFYMKKEVLLARTLNLPMLPIIAPSSVDEDQVIKEIRVALDESYEMRLLSEVQWIIPTTDYETTLQNLIEAIEKAVKQSDDGLNNPT